MEDGERDPEEPIIIDDDVLEILRQALIEDKKTNREGKDLSPHDLNETLGALINEFLSCFQLFGYDFDGNLVEIKKTSNNMEKAAMDNLFIQKFGDFMADRGGMRDDKFDF